MPQPEALYHIPATEASIGRFNQINDGLLEFALPQHIDAVQTSVSFRQTVFKRINIYKPNFHGPFDYDYLVSADFIDEEDNSSTSFYIDRVGKIKRQKKELKSAVIEVSGGKSLDEIINERERALMLEIEGRKLEDEFGFTEVTEGELLDAIEKLERIDPETQLVRE